MKGVVFCEFLAFVEREMGADMVDDIIEDSRSALSTGGAYTSVGTYPCAEMGALLGALSARADIPAKSLLQSFGGALAKTFAYAYPEHFRQANDLFDFLSRIDAYIHVEVKKLYPDAELPSFELLQRDEQQIVLRYRSPRGLHDLATGLFLGSAGHFGEPVNVDMKLADEPGEAVFTISRQRG